MFSQEPIPDYNHNTQNISCLSSTCARALEGLHAEERSGVRPKTSNCRVGAFSSCCTSARRDKKGQLVTMTTCDHVSCGGVEETHEGAQIWRCPSIYDPRPILAVQKPPSEPISPAYSNIIIFIQTRFGLMKRYVKRTDFLQGERLLPKCYLAKLPDSSGDDSRCALDMWTNIMGFTKPPLRLRHD